MCSLTADTRGVSEIIGFVLVFTLVIGTISIVYVGGFAGLDDTRDAERVNNAERAFDVMANNFQQMGRGDAPHRATEIKLADAQLGTSNTTRLTRVNASGSVVAESTTVTIRYDAPGDTRLVYENGAVIRVDDGSATMRREPDFIFDDGNVVIRNLALRGESQGAGGSASTVLVRAERRASFVNNSEATQDVEILHETHEDHAPVWKQYYEREIEAAGGPADACSIDTNPSIGGPDTDVVECGTGGNFDPDSLAVARITIDVTIT